MLHAARSAYHKWACGVQSQRAAENEQLTDKIEKIYAESPDKGYRRLNDDLRHDYGIHVNDKRVLRICRARDIRSTVKYNNHSCTRRAKTPQYLAENLLSRQFYADKPNEKWLTDVTKFKWYEGVEVHKLYLSAILDLCDRRIVFYALSERNEARRKILCKRFSTKSRMALENRADSGLDPLITESHGGQSGMRAGTA